MPQAAACGATPPRVTARTINDLLGDMVHYTFLNRPQRSIGEELLACEAECGTQSEPGAAVRGKRQGTNCTEAHLARIRAQ